MAVEALVAKRAVLNRRHDGLFEVRRTLWRSPAASQRAASMTPNLSAAPAGAARWWAASPVSAIMVASSAGALVEHPESLQQAFHPSALEHRRASTRHVSTQSGE